MHPITLVDGTLGAGDLPSQQSRPVKEKQPEAPPASIPALADRHVTLVDPAKFDLRLRAESGDRMREIERLRGLAIPKPLLMPQAVHLQALADLAVRAPNCAGAVRAVARQVKRSLLGVRALHLGNVLLAGPPGCGKSHFCHAMAEALSLPLFEFQMAGSGDVLALTGSSRGWANAGPGRLASWMADAPAANPIVFIDEIDKAGAAQWGSIDDAVLMLTEPQNANRYDDKFLAVPLNLSFATFWFAANDPSKLSAPLRSRLREYPISPPDTAAWPALIQLIYTGLLDAQGLAAHFVSPLPADVVVSVSLGADSIREVKRRLLDGIDGALDDLDAERLDAACGLLPVIRPTAAPARRGMGFLVQEG